MTDGGTHLKYKAENAVDLETEIIVAAEVYHSDCGDTSTIEDTVMTAQTHLHEARTECEIKEVVADKGYHSEDSLDRLQNESQWRAYIPEQQRKTNRKWTNKSRRKRRHRPRIGRIGRLGRLVVGGHSPAATGGPPNIAD